jgi:hypothetical protein
MNRDIAKCPNTGSTVLTSGRKAWLLIQQHVYDQMIITLTTDSPTFRPNEKEECRERARGVTEYFTHEIGSYDILKRR